MLCINTFGRVMYFPDQAKKKIQNGRTLTLRKIQRKVILPMLLEFSLNLNTSTCMQYVASLLAVKKSNFKSNLW